MKICYVEVYNEVIKDLLSGEIKQGQKKELMLMKPVRDRMRCCKSQ